MVNHPQPVTLSDGELILRCPTPDQVPAITAACQDRELHRWLEALPDPYTEADAATFVRTCEDNWANGKENVFAVTAAEDGRLLGMIALHDIANLTAPGGGMAEVGFWTVAAERGRGVIPKALRLVCRYGFDELGLAPDRVAGRGGQHLVPAGGGEGRLHLRGHLPAPAAPCGQPCRRLARRTHRGGAPVTLPVLRADGMLLRAWTLDDWQGVLRLADDEGTRRWSPSLRTVFTRPDAEAWLELRQERGINWAVVDPASDELMGRVGLHHFDDEDNSAEIGYGVLPTFRRKGVATRAVGAAVAYGFGERGLVRVSLEHGVGNHASCAVARAGGFAFEGIKRAGIRSIDDGYDDAHLHARLATDPPPEAEPGRPVTPVEIAAGAYQLCIPDAGLDAATILAACTDPLIKLFNAGPTTLDEARAWCEGRADWSDGTHASWLVKDTAGTLLGAVSLFEIDRKSLDCQAGYWVAAPARGRRIASAALAAAARFAFGVLALNRVELFHAVENEASCRTALRSGFAIEGVHRQSYRYGDGVLRDEHSHARLATDAG